MDKFNLLMATVDLLNMDDKWKRYLQEFVYDCRVRSLTPRTIDTYCERLSCLSKFLDAKRIDIEDIDRKVIRTYVMETINTVSDETIAGRIRAWRRFWNFLIDEELWTGPNPLAGIKIRCEKKLKELVSPKQFDSVLSACNKKTFEGYRNYAMLLTAWDTMIRRAEIQNLTVDNVDLDSCTIKVFGKGRKWRYVPISAKTIKVLHRYMHKFRNGVGGTSLFCNRNGQQISYTHIHQICRRTAKRAGVSLGCHQIRHSAATEYIRSGGPLAVLSKILGHSQIGTTSIYVHMSVDDAVRSYERFAPASSLTA